MLAPFNPYAPSGAKQFLFNQTYDITQKNEANLFDNINSEFTYLYGSDFVYMPKEVGPAEAIFGEYLAAVIDRGFPIRLFIEEVEAWSGGGDMFSKFGLQVTDECTLFCNKTTFSNASQAASGVMVYPKEGDLVYVVKAKKLFEVSNVEDATSPGFYLFGNRTGYKIQCKMFTYNHEVISQSPSAGIPTAIQALDALLAATEGNTTVTLNQKEITNNNVPIRTQTSTVLDTSEEDALI
jgi:hypothetical protein